MLGIGRMAVLMGQDWSPSISLDLTSALDSRITFARASNALYYNSSGVLTLAANDVARFEHDPATLAARGLMIEEQRTNLFTYSEQLNNAAWSKSGISITPDAVAAPDGATTADLVIPSSSTGSFKQATQAANYTSGVTYVYSAFFKKGVYKYVQMISSAGPFGGGYINFDLDLGTEVFSGNSGTPWTVVRKTITNAGSGFYRIEVAITCISTTSGNFDFNPIPAFDSARGVSWAGDGTSGFYVWGKQLSAGAFATSYIPTTSASAVREADSATMTGAAFSSWWGASSGAIVVQATSPASGTRVVFQADDGTANNRITIYTSGTTVLADVVAGGITQASLNLGSITAGTAFKVALRYGANDFAASLNGAAVVADTNGSMPSADRARLGAGTAGNHLCGTIAMLKGYRDALPDGVLRGLTA